MIDSNEGSSTLRNPGKEPIRQFVIYAEHKVGWLNDFVSMLKEEDIHILALSVSDTTDTAVIRLITNCPKDLARFLKGQSISFTERLILAVELDDTSSLFKVTQSLLRAEINIHYIYSFMHQPNGRPVLAMAMEDEDIAEDVLRSHQVRILTQDDLSR
ncbi:acetolactate synthase [Opitutales bacterium]|jgi:hypothetical protein|nr:acetolactate synthase [Opitutales bacterium]